MKKFLKLIKNNTEKLIFLFCLFLVIYIRIKLLSMPLDRDEGGWAYAGWLILEGIPPFKYFYDTKMPGLYYLYAFFQLLFGKTGEGIRMGILLFILLNIFLVYKIAFKLTYSMKDSIIAASLYSIFTLDINSLSLYGYSSHFVLTFVILGLILLFNAIENKKTIFYFLSGISFGLSFLMKQPAIYYFVFFLIYIILNETYFKSNTNIKDTIKKTFYFIFGFLVMFFLICILMKIQNVFEKFWFMTVVYSIIPLYKITLEFIIIDFLSFLEISSIYFKIIFLLTIICFFYFLIFEKNKEKRFFYLFLILATVFFSSQGFIFRTHYFIVWFLPSALLFTEKFITERFKKILLLFLLFVLVITQGNYLFKLSPIMLSRYIYGFNLFSESPKIAEFIKNNTEKDDRIAILGSEPQILFYAKRKSATGYLYGNQLMATNKFAKVMQLEAIKEIETAKPKYLIFINIPTSWIIKPDSTKIIFDWFEKQKKKNLEPVMSVNFYSIYNIEYITDKEEILKFKSPYFIIIYKYKN